MAYTPINQITPYPMWSAYTPTLPALYWDVDSHEERIKRLCLELQKIVDYSDYLGKNLNIDQTAIKELQDDFEKFQESGFDDYYLAQIEKWIDAHLDSLFATYSKGVYFGLTKNGYFCAYVPESWSDIQFDTGAVYGRSDYGRLILRFEPDPDAAGVIDNTYNYDGYAMNDVPDELVTLINEIISDLETTANRIDRTYDTLYTNLDEEVSDGNF